MTQLKRRIFYSLAGVAPASLALLDSPKTIPVVIGFAGLLLATLATFPVKRHNYLAITVMLVVGLVFSVPFAILFLAGLFTAGFDGVDRVYLLLSWVLFGCCTVALHFILRARAPNNSFKPKPLRGSA